MNGRSTPVTRGSAGQRRCPFFDYEADAYRGISWRVVFLIVGLLPLSLAMINTGLAEYIGQSMVAVMTPYGPLALTAGLFLVTMVVALLALLLGMRLFWGI